MIHYSLCTKEMQICLPKMSYVCMQGKHSIEHSSELQLTSTIILPMYAFVNFVCNINVYKAQSLEHPSLFILVIMSQIHF